MKYLLSISIAFTLLLAFCTKPDINAEPSAPLTPKVIEQNQLNESAFLRDYSKGEFTGYIKLNYPIQIMVKGQYMNINSAAELDIALSRIDEKQPLMLAYPLQLQTIMDENYQQLNSAEEVVEALKNCGLFHPEV